MHSTKLLNCTVLTPSTACYLCTSTGDLDRCDVLPDSVPTEVSWNISTDFRELCTRLLNEGLNERNVALCQLSLATLNYEPVNILDISV